MILAVETSFVNTQRINRSRIGHDFVFTNLYLSAVHKRPFYISFGAERYTVEKMSLNSQKPRSSKPLDFF